MKTLIKILTIILLSTCSNSPDSISISEFEATGIMGRFLKKEGNHIRPIVIILPGSSMGFIKESEIYGIVENGYDVLSLAYYGIGNLSKQIEHIPIEGINNSITWLEKNGIKEERKIVLLGISKGAELGLVYASKYNNIDGLACYSPSNIVLPNHVGINNEENYKSSWSHKGKEINFSNLKKFIEPAGKIEYRKYISPILKDSVELGRGRIKVEDIKCPILLMSGKEDKVWSSFEMSELIKRDVEKNINAKEKHKVKVVGYEKCGHQFFWFGNGDPQKITTSQSMRITGIKKHRFIYGGEKEWILKAMKESKREFFNFISGL